MGSVEHRKLSDRAWAAERYLLQPALLAEKMAFDESNFTCMFAKNTRKFDELTA